MNLSSAESKDRQRVVNKSAAFGSKASKFMHHTKCIIIKWNFVTFSFKTKNGQMEGEIKIAQKISAMLKDKNEL